MTSATVIMAGSRPVALTCVGGLGSRRRPATSSPSFAPNPRPLAATFAKRFVVPQVGMRAPRSARTLALDVRAEAVAQSPPIGKDMAIQQASTAIEAVVNRTVKPKPAKGKKGRKKSENVGFTDEQKSGKRAQVLVPINDNSPKDLSQLTKDILTNLSVSTSTVVYFGDSKAVPLFQTGMPPNTEARSLGGVDSMELTPSGTSLVLLVGPTLKQLEAMKTVSTRTSCSCVLVNAEWDPDSLPAGEKSFLESFQIVYWHLPLAIEGLIRKSEGAVFKFVESGAPASTQWKIYWAGEEINTQTKRPSPIQLEQILYNKAAEDSAMVKAASVVGNAKDKVTSMFGFGKKS